MIGAIRWRSGAVLLALALCAGCSYPPEDAMPPPGEQPVRLGWAIAIHGGAGTIPRDIAEDRRQAYVESLRRALQAGVEVLDGGGTSLDAVERVIVLMEDDPLFNAGRGAVFNFDGGHELDAAIMDGSDLACGAVAAVTTIRNPIRLARRVMEDTRHILLAGPGADRFAAESGMERVEPSWFDTESRREAWRRFVESAEGEAERGTVGVVALDREGNLAAGTSTGGLTGKRFGRVGDTPIIGAGTYASNASCAVSCTGIGEEFIRHAVAHSIAMLVEDGVPIRKAVDRIVHEVLRPGDGGVVAVDFRGEIAAAFNTEGMYRGAADASGRFEIAIWDDEPEGS